MNYAPPDWFRPPERYSHLLERFNERLVVSFAHFAASELDLIGFAYVGLSPGDGTLYKIVVVRPPTREQWDRWERRHLLPPDHEYYERRPEFNDKGEYLVAHSIGGALYGWNGGEMHPDYVFEKWTRGRRETPDEWTAYVIARFLTHLSTAIRERKEET